MSAPPARLEWRAALSGDEQEQVAALIAAAAHADGVDPVGERVMRDLAGDHTGHLLATEPSRGGVVGYLNRAEDTAELAVHPSARRAGVGAALVGAARDRGLARFWAHGTLPAARELARAAGLVAVRELLKLSRPLQALPEEPLPAGIRMVTYRGPEQHADLIRVNSAAFDWHPEQGRWGQTDVAERIAAPWFDPAGLFLAYDDAGGSLLGFHWTKIHGPDTGEVYVVGVDPAAQGRGLGRALTLVGMRHLARRLGPGSQVILYVESDNTAALTTYQGLGFSVAGVDTVYAW